MRLHFGKKNFWKKEIVIYAEKRKRAVSVIIDPLTDKKTPVLVKLLLGAVLILPVVLIICYIVFECN